MYEITFWGGPKDGHVEYQASVPQDEVYCLDNTSGLLDLFDVYNEKSHNHDIDCKKYSKYKIKKITKGKYKYIFNGLL